MLPCQTARDPKYNSAENEKAEPHDRCVLDLPQSFMPHSAERHLLVQLLSGLKKRSEAVGPRSDYLAVAAIDQHHGSITERHLRRAVRIRVEGEARELAGMEGRSI